MATRYYLGGITAAPVSPTPSASWDVLGTTQRSKMTTSKLLVAPSGTAAAAPNQANVNRMFRQYVSDPIPSQTITGTIKGQILCREQNTTNDVCIQVTAYVVSNDGTTVRGTLLAVDNSALSHEFAITTDTNRTFPRGGAASVTQVAAQSNDRIVVELGYRIFAATSNTIRMLSEDNTGADLGENETDTVTGDSWVEFSGVTEVASVRRRRVVGMGLGRGMM